MSDATQERGVSTLIEQAGTIALPAGLMIYAVLYLPLQRFYESLGVTPEQAGFDQIVLLSRMVLVLFNLVVLGLPVVALVASLGWLAHKATFGHLRRLSGLLWARSYVAVPLIAICAALLVVNHPIFSAVGSEAMWLTALVALCYLIPVMWLRRRRKGQTALAMTIVLITAGWLSVVLSSGAHDAAVRLREDGTISHGALSLPRILGIVPQFTTARWVNGARPLVGQNQVLYVLGTSDGMHALYDCKGRRVIMVSAEGVDLTSLSVSAGDHDIRATCR